MEKLTNDKANIRRKALDWWRNLSFGKQMEYEMATFGCGEYWENNETLETEDILKMHNQHSA